MRERKFEKSHIHFLESETLRRESRVTESSQEIVDSIPYNCLQYPYVYQLPTIIYFWCRGKIYKNMGILLGECLTCEELVGVTHRR